MRKDAHAAHEPVARRHKTQTLTTNPIIVAAV